MKTPLTYYGGKQRLASKIIPLIPPHHLYCEPFVGGGAIFFQKPKSQVEVLNDINGELVNFYIVVQTKFRKLQKEIQSSLHSRDLHRKASVIYNNPDMFDAVKRAWAVWILASQSFASRLNGTWGYDVKENSTSLNIARKRDAFVKTYADRLRSVQLECTDALRIIKSRDRKDSFFYCDPPYFNSDMGHYDGYTQKDFERLLEVLSGI